MKLLFLPVLAALGIFSQAPRAEVHGFFGFDNPPGNNFDYSSAGLGADIFVYKGAAISPSAGYLFIRGAPNIGLAVVTANGSYHFLRGKSRIEPFVTVGYGALANLSGGQSMFNYGGGANFWFRKHIGFRAELLNFQTNSYRELTTIRLGVTFR
ncbi:MAG: hypothetical protein HYX27_00505 [Acidobacteria bacterium]|nr:hypothetical protein [Acidobacteriota bacterium]